MQEQQLDEIIAKYVRPKTVVSIGADILGETLLQKLSLRKEMREIQVVPTSLGIAQICSENGIRIASLNDTEIDLAIDFVDRIDEAYNFVKTQSKSIVKDKMVAQSATELVAIAPKDAFQKRISGTVPFEVLQFGYKRTMMQLQSYGNARLREKNSEPEKTETGNYIIDVGVSPIYSLEDLDIQTKQIPGVIETGLFIGYADTIILHSEAGITEKTRLEEEPPNNK